MAEPRKFWMVYGANQRAPAYCHGSEEAASHEAKRLAAKHPGIEFYVLESAHRALKVDVTFERVPKTRDANELSW